LLPRFRRPQLSAHARSGRYPTFPSTDARLQYLGGVDDSVEVVFGYRTELQRDTVVVREVRRKVDQSVLDPRTVSLFGGVTNGKASELRDFGCRSFQQNQFGIEFTYAL
jgi:hypothetical protein